MISAIEKNRENQLLRHIPDEAWNAVLDGANITVVVNILRHHFKTMFDLPTAVNAYKDMRLMLGIT